MASTNPNWMFGQPLSDIWDKLVDSDVFIPVCSANANVSTHLRDEINTCLTLNIPILVFRMDEVDLPPELIPRWHIRCDPTRPWGKHRIINDLIPQLIEWHRENMKNVKSPISSGGV